MSYILPRRITRLRSGIDITTRTYHASVGAAAAAMQSPLAAPSGLGPRAPRNLVLLLDGTGNQFGSTNSNIIKLMSVFAIDESQIVFYSSGVGTILPEAATYASKLKQTLQAGWAEATAFNFETFVCDAYKFLMDYYQTGDKVYILGFSRGAYTARAVAGMVQKVGLLPAGNHNQIKLAYQVYKARDHLQPETARHHNHPQSLSGLYRQIFGISRPVSIHFVGVFDTVSSLGGWRKLPRLAFAGGVHAVQFFRQALALDERRVRFAPEYRRRDTAEPDPMPDLSAEKLLDVSRLLVKQRESTGDHEVEDEVEARLDDDLVKGYPLVALVDGKPRRKSVECWFMGCHSDVGGGNDLNDQHSLSNISFRWMLREVAQCGIRLDPVGMALQPAVAECSNVLETEIIPGELRRSLKHLLRAAAIEADEFDRLKKQVDEQLDRHKLSQIVELAAAGDTQHDQTPFADETTSAGRQSTKPNIDDLLRMPKESLKGPWWILELLRLETRYQDPEGVMPQVDRYVRHWGKPRQMARSQAIHRSVQTRLRYEHAHPSAVRYGDENGEPHARLPGCWATTWDQLRDEGGPPVWED